MTEITIEMRSGQGLVYRTLKMSELTLEPTNDGTIFPAIMRCPHCGVIGAFAGGNGCNFAQLVNGPTGGALQIHLWYGVRPCPNQACRAPVFLIARGPTVLASFPPEAIDFDITNVPERIASCLSEAVISHSHGCYRAAALLVRRSLEELCHDRGAEGKTLKDRIAALRDIITLPKALFEAMDELRLLGNDAAHIEAKTYEEIGGDEVSAAVELTKEVIKAAYQFEDLLARLKKLGSKKNEA